MSKTHLVENVLRTLDLLDPELLIERSCYALEDDRGVLHRHHRDPLMLLLMNIQHPQHNSERLDTARMVVTAVESLASRTLCSACFLAEDAVLLSLVESEFGEAAYALFTAKRLTAMNSNPDALDEVANHASIDSFVDGWLRLCETLESEADGLFIPTRRDWELIIETAVEGARSNLNRLHRDLFTHHAVDAQLRSAVSGLSLTVDPTGRCPVTDDESLVSFVADALSTHDGWLSSPEEIAAHWPMFPILRNLTVAYAPETVDHVAVAEVPAWVADAIYQCDPSRMRSRLHRSLQSAERDTAAKLFSPYGQHDVYNSYDTCVETARALVL